MKVNRVQCRAARRCFLVFTAIALLPLALVYLVTNEQAYKLKGYEFEGELYYEAKSSRLVSSNSKQNGPDVITIQMRNLNKTIKFRDIRSYFDADPVLAYSKKTLVEKSFRYPLMILGPLKALANRAAGSSSYKYNKRHKDFANVSLQTLPYDEVRTIPPNKLEMVEQRMKKRQKLLAQKCSELGLDSIGNDSMHKPNPWEFLVNHKYHIIWCNVFKAASSSWMYNFNILAGYSPGFLKKSTDVPLVLARRKYPRVALDELRDAQNDSITFIIARHPFERLLSAYRDKFIFALPHSFHDKLGSKIIRSYRKNKAERYTPKYPTFSEFVSWLLDEVRKNNNIDMHLVPATKFCTPCLIKFDVIVKFETLEEDQLYLIDKAGLANVIMPEWRNTGKGKKTLELLQTFYSQLTRKQLDGLYNYFRYDFEVFGYNAAPYFSIVKTEENSKT